MAEIINLRMARKAKRRTDKEQAAAANRAQSGQSKATRLARKQEVDRAGRMLDGAKRDQD